MPNFYVDVEAMISAARVKMETLARGGDDPLINEANLALVQLQLDASRYIYERINGRKDMQLTATALAVACSHALVNSLSVFPPEQRLNAAQDLLMVMQMTMTQDMEELRQAEEAKRQNDPTPDNSLDMSGFTHQLS